MNIPQALHAVGDGNRYQFYTTAFVCFKWLACTFIILGPSYLLMTPTFTCGFDSKVSENEACPKISECTIDYMHTLTSQLGLYCDQRFVRDSILSSEYIGSLVGLVLLSILADKIGRKIIIVITIFASLVGSLVFCFGGTYHIVPLLYVGIIMMGFGAYSLSIVSLTYLAQVNSDRLRQITTVMTFTFWAIAEILFYPMIVNWPQWEVFMSAYIIGPLLLLLVGSYFIVETPYFLHARNKSECLYSLNYIARFNRKTLLTMNDLENYKSNPEEQYKARDTILKWRFLLPVIVLSIGQICNNGMYYITQFSINQIGQTFELNMLLIGCLELLGYIVINIFCYRMRRKLWLILVMLLSGTIGVLFQFVFRNQDSGWNPTRIIETLFIAFSRLANTFGFALFSLITTESFPSSIKTTGTGVVEALSNLGNMASPFIVTIADKMGIQSICIGGVVCLVGAVAMLFSKETLPKTDLPGYEEPLLRESTMEANQEQPEVQMRQ